jgi:hypothetical protein
LDSAKLVSQEMVRISSIEISGFKSYKDRFETAAFSPKINVVVGANGSGKSNFFHGKRLLMELLWDPDASVITYIDLCSNSLFICSAIRFVLNDVGNMRAEERTQLLHVSPCRLSKQLEC